MLADHYAEVAAKLREDSDEEDSCCGVCTYDRHEPSSCRMLLRSSGERAGDDFATVQFLRIAETLRNEVKLAGKMRLERCVTGVRAQDINI
jgi:hypothetical protein